MHATIAIARFDVMCPYPRSRTSLVDAAMLDDVELKWLNDYNATVRTALQPLMEAQFPEAMGYLLQETEPLLR